MTAPAVRQKALGDLLRTIDGQRGQIRTLNKKIAVLEVERDTAERQMRDADMYSRKLYRRVAELETKLRSAGIEP